MKKIILLLLLICNIGLGAEPINFGWSAPSNETSKVSQTTSSDIELRSLIKYNDEDDVLLHDYLYKALEGSNQLTEEEKTSKRLNSLNQGNYGFCVGFSGALCVDILKSTDIYLRNDRERWITRTNPIAIYSLGRYDNRGRYDGSSGAWQTSAYLKYGTLFRLQYPSFDLKALNNGDVGRQWAAQGMPRELLAEASSHKVLSCAKIKTVQEAIAAIQNGYPITICAAASYGNHRDSNGFIKLSGRDWNHSMTVTGYRKKTPPEGFLITNSWGNNWCDGPVFPETMAHGSFWVTPKDLLFHLQQDDSYAIAGFDGFKRRELKWEEIFRIGEEIEDQE